MQQLRLTVTNQPTYQPTNLPSAYVSLEPKEMICRNDLFREGDFIFLRGPPKTIRFSSFFRAPATRPDVQIWINPSPKKCVTSLDDMTMRDHFAELTGRACIGRD